MTVEDLADLEAIRNLKARYCLLLDAQRWDDLRGLFTDDCVFSVGSGDYRSPDAFIDNLRVNLAGELHAHLVSNPILAKTAADAAHGLWTFTNRGAIGHYSDRYRRDGRWRFAGLTMTWILPPSDELLRTRKGQFAATAPRWQALAAEWGIQP